MRHSAYVSIRNLLLTPWFLIEEIPWFLLRCFPTVFQILPFTIMDHLDSFQLLILRLVELPSVVGGGGEVCSFAAAGDASIGGPSLGDWSSLAPRQIPRDMQIGAVCYPLCHAPWGEGGSPADSLQRRQLNVSVFNWRRSRA